MKNKSKYSKDEYKILGMHIKAITNWTQPVVHVFQIKHTSVILENKLLIYSQITNLKILNDKNDDSK